MQTLVGIGRAVGANVGHVRQLWLVDYRDVLSITDPGKIPTLAPLPADYRLPARALQLIETAMVIEVKFAHDSSLYSEVLTETPMGEQYLTTLQVAAPKDRLAVAQAVAMMSGRRFVAVIVDNNGQQKILGSTRQPLRFSSTLDVAAGHRLLVFTAMTGRTAWFSQEIMTDYMSADAEFTYGFSLDFTS